MRIAVIGAGWAGCSAAVELSRRGHQVDLFEAARTLGGRARQVDVHGVVVDNGQHILVGAYRATLALLKTLGQQNQLLRLPLQMCYPAPGDGMHLQAAPLPAPWHMLVGLIRARGLDRADKLSLARFSTTARWMDWQLDQDCSVATLMERFDQTPNLVRLMWAPLCIAALNTPIERASAQIFLNVLRDSLGAGRRASDMLLPTTDLTTLMPQAAAAYVVAHGGSVHVGQAVQTIEQAGSDWQLRCADTATTHDGVVLATAPAVARQLLAPLDLASHIPDYAYEPITTCYLQYADTVRLPRHLLALIERPDQNAFGQFVFDRGQIDGKPGLLAVVISASQPAIEQGHAQLAAGCAEQLALDLHMPALSQPLWSQVITEKRATFACTPDLPRPTPVLPMPNLVLAGDYTFARYPATLEAAVQSGVLAAATFN